MNNGIKKNAIGTATAAMVGLVFAVTAGSAYAQRDPQVRQDVGDLHEHQDAEATARENQARAAAAGDHRAERHYKKRKHVLQHKVEHDQTQLREERR